MLHSLSGPLPHLLCESLAYLVGARLYWRTAARQPRPPSALDRLALLAGAVCGAALGSKLLHVLEHLPALRAVPDPALWLGGKSVVGGFLGGTLGVELAKARIGWRASTGDAWVLPLALGLMIGRVGCQLSGVWDQTYGVPTALPWAWDYGDGIGRHPTAAYEILLVAGLLLLLRTRRCRNWPPGSRFAAFLAGYCTIRFMLDFLKPPFGAVAAGSLPVARYAGLSAIQWACAAAVPAYLALLRRRLRAVRSP